MVVGRGHNYIACILSPVFLRTLAIYLYFCGTKSPTDISHKWKDRTRKEMPNIWRTFSLYNQFTLQMCAHISACSYSSICLTLESSAASFSFDESYCLWKKAHCCRHTMGLPHERPHFTVEEKRFQILKHNCLTFYLWVYFHL